MSDFLDYYKKEEQKKAMTEEQRLALHKKQKQIAAHRHQIDEDDDFYDEELPDINEGVRLPNRPKQRPIPQKQTTYNPAPISRPAPRPIPRPAPAPAPIQQEPEFVDPFDSLPPRQKPTAPAARTKRSRLVEESTIPALKEAYIMMDEMQHKIESMFYRYGMAGLEKINECMEDVFEEIINPVQKPEIKYIEKPVEVPVMVKPRKKVIKKSTPIKQKITEQIDEDFDEPVRSVKPTINTISKKELNPEEIQEAFEEINNSFDIDKLGDSLIEQGITQQNTTSKMAETLKNVEARAKLLQETIDKNNAPEITDQTDETYVQSEEFDIVDDNVIDDPISEAKNYELEESNAISKYPTIENVESDELTDLSEKNEEE